MTASVKSHWPAIQTDPAAAHGKTARVMITGIIGTSLGSFVVGAVMILVGIILAKTSGSSDLPSVFGSVGIILLYSPFFSWIGLLLGVPFAVTALRKGYAGWFVSVGAGALVGAAVFAVAAGFEQFAVGFGIAMGATLAGLFWLSIRLFQSDAIVGRP